MKICLNLSGQIRLSPEQSLLDKIEHIKNYIDFDKIYMHLWLDDYLKYKNEIDKIENKSLVILDIPKLDKKFYIPEISKIRTPYLNKEFDYVCEFYGVQSVFQKSCLEDNDIYIRARYDSIYTKKLNLNKYINLLDSDMPSAIVPMGGDWHNGLGNAFCVMNKQAAWCMKNILFDFYNMCKDNIPFHPESLLRAHFINYNNFNLYRISFPIIINQSILYNSETFLGDYIVQDKMKFISEYLI